MTVRPGAPAASYRSSRADKLRSMYTGGRPTNAAKAIHRRFVNGPLPRLLPIAGVLEVRGRVSGNVISVPVAPVRYRGEWYLVSMLGERSNWVANVRAAAGEAVLLHGRRRAVHLVEEARSEQKAPIIKRYLFFALSARPHVAVSWRAPISEILVVVGRYPVFRIEKKN